MPSNNEEALPPPKHLTYLLVLSPSSPEAAWEGGKGKWRRRRNEPEAPLSPSPQKVINRVPHIFRPLSLPATPMHAAELSHFAFLLPLPPRTARNSRNNFPRQEYPARAENTIHSHIHIPKLLSSPPSSTPRSILTSCVPCTAAERLPMQEKYMVYIRSPHKHGLRRVGTSALSLSLCVLFFTPAKTDLRM